MKRIGLVFLLAGAGALAQQKPDTAQQQMLLRIQQAQRQVVEADLAKQLEKLRQTYSESHPDIVKLKAQLDNLRAAKSQADAKYKDWVLLYPSLPAKSRSSWVGLPDRPDKWWNDPAIAASTGLTPDQRKKMDDVFQQYRLKLIDLNAALEKEEVTLEPLVAAEPLDDSKIAAQIDRVAQARAELEKANGRMLLGIRKMLTQDQWNKLQKGAQ